ncbi:unnamed protein product [Hymenolepis diminuta]|uniref:Uncharacterized protein n=1 Tax=Hymenolepis diminuta TaxID=6216 RepID=A0A0R3SL56_HYMDI|nr:unnamed protein product [Hymenolepis diminuta]
MPHVGAQIWVRNRKNLRPRYAALISQPKMDLAEMYRDTCYLPPPRNIETSEIAQTVIPDASEVLGRDSRLIQRSK